MNCPTCPGDKLVMSERSGIEIDYCPTCRGVWLDRGELDKLIERSISDTAPAARPAPERAEPVTTSRDRDDHRDRDDGHRPKRRKRESFLGDLFDF